MKDNRLQFVILAVAMLVLAALLSALVIFRAAARWGENALAERNQVGFVVSTGGVVFRTPNSELMAPAWKEPVIMADPATFKTIFHSTEFCLGADSKTVFMGEGRRVYRLNNSQASTFRLLTPDGRFACDAQHVYFMGLELPQADPASFKILGQFTSIDSTRVYVGPVLLQGADPMTFRIVEEGELPELRVAYSDGPCTIRKLDDDSFFVKGFHGQDKNKRFGGQINRR